MKYGYGCLGFLSLLGILGIVTEERTFLAFFGFAVDFQYFFRKTDDEQYFHSLKTDNKRTMER